MLIRLSIRDVVLIQKLDLTLHDGLTVLTGETGAGKSILLDSLGLALGHRSDAGLLRKGSEQASAAAVFDVPDAHAARAVACENGIDTAGEELILRRVLGKDGRTRAFINDQPVSVSLLKRVGEELVEIHGQFETQRLLEPTAHGPLLDAYCRASAEILETRNAFEEWSALAARLEAAEEAARMSAENEDFLRHAVDELRELDPVAGEEAELAEKRRLLQHGEQISQALSEAQGWLSGDGGVEELTSKALDALERVQPQAGGRLDDAIAALQRAFSELADSTAYLDRAASAFDLDPSELEQAEERLFTLRAVARKHNVDVDALADLRTRFEDEIADLDSGGQNLERLKKETAAAKDAFVGAAKKLSAVRRKAADELQRRMSTELQPLKLGNATFSVAIDQVTDESKWSARGIDKVAFQVATNSGAAPGPLNKIASGGELSRFMLALKVVLADVDPVPVLIFDEVDAGIGGAVAAAVGDRLSALGAAVQVLVVTHSPQVAATGRHHLTVAKTTAKTVEGEVTSTQVQTLDDDARCEEVARMLAGEVITGEARAAAESLLKGAA